MKISLLTTIACSLIAFAFISCSEPEVAPLQVNEVKIHLEGWNTPASQDFHGKVLAAKNFDSAECRQCHGSQFDGGIADVSCRTCHESFPHPANWVGLSANSHSSFIKANSYSFAQCKSCHGQNYQTIKTDNSCRTCHAGTNGPEACNTCHGMFAAEDVLANAAPPAGLDNETDPANAAVGSHQPHLAYYASVEATCQECHTVPATLMAAGHIDGDGHADVVFQSTLAVIATEGGARQPIPAYSHETLNCANTYCHGNWGLLKADAGENSFIYAEDKIEGNTATPVWTDPNSAACGTCHDLPPKGHNPFGIQACSTCHSGVMDRLGNIIDKTKHINGKINVFQQEYPMF